MEARLTAWATFATDAGMCAKPPEGALDQADGDPRPETRHKEWGVVAL